MRSSCARPVQRSTIQAGVGGREVEGPVELEVEVELEVPFPVEQLQARPLEVRAEPAVAVATELAEARDCQSDGDRRYEPEREPAEQPHRESAVKVFLVDRVGRVRVDIPRL